MKNENSRLLYGKPKILLVDCSDKCQVALRTSGWNCTPGTFGGPYTCERSPSMFLVTNESLSLPGYQEQEIVIIDTACTASGPGPEREVVEGIKELWCGGQDGLIDPRPLLMAGSRSAFDNILQHGGLFIVVLSKRYAVKYFHGTSYDLQRGRLQGTDYSNRSFLGALDEFHETSNRGTEIHFDMANSLGRLLESSRDSMTYETTLNHWGQYNRAKWTPIAWNKYEEEIAGILQPASGNGLVLLLPQIKDFHVILPRLLSEWATSKMPHLFPEHTTFKWIHRPEYEIDEVIQLNTRRETIRQDFEKEIQEIGKEIEKVQQEYSYYYSLLNGTGEELVLAVIAALHEIGFEHVVNVDAERKEQNLANDLREDIRIEDRSPLLVVEVRGLSGLPSDEDLTQAENHALMCTRELARTDVLALTIINYERNLPPHERNAKPFRDEMVKNAEDTKSGLMTTWDLFRLLRSARQLRWQSEHLLESFYQKGWIRPIPGHYLLAGSVKQVWTDKFGFLATETVSQGSRLAVETGDTYAELSADSLQIDGKSVASVAPGSKCGVKLAGSSAMLKKGARVYIISI